VSKLRKIFWESLLCVKTWVFFHHISDYFIDVSKTFIGSSPGQLPGWPSP
jgi:hypothetical protein